MASVRETTTTSATPERVWSVLANPATFSSWQDNHEGFVGEPPTELAPGSSFGQRLRLLGMVADVRWRVEGLEGPRRLVYSGNGPMGITLTATFLLEPKGAGTTVNAAFDFSGPAVLAVSNQLQREVSASLVTNLGRLKSLAEA